jgi:hypothetical protein
MQCFAVKITIDYRAFRSVITKATTAGEAMRKVEKHWGGRWKAISATVAN